MPDTKFDFKKSERVEEFEFKNLGELKIRGQNINFDNVKLYITLGGRSDMEFLHDRHYMPILALEFTNCKKVTPVSIACGVFIKDDLHCKDTTHVMKELIDHRHTKSKNIKTKVYPYFENEFKKRLLHDLEVSFGAEKSEIINLMYGGPTYHYYKDALGWGGDMTKRYPWHG